MIIPTIEIIIIVFTIIIARYVGTKNKYLSITTYIAAFWVGSIFLTDINLFLPFNKDLAIYASRFSFIFGSLIFHFIYLFLINIRESYLASLKGNKKVKLLVISSIIIQLIYIPISISNLIVEDVNKVGDELVSVRGGFYSFTAIIFGLLVLTTVILIVIQLKKSKDPIIKYKLDFILIGIVISVIWIIITNIALPMLKFPEIRILGPVGLLFFLGFTTYALMKERIVSLRTFLLSIIKVIIVGTVLFGVVFLTRLFQAKVLAFDFFQPESLLIDFVLSNIVSIFLFLWLSKFNLQFNIASKDRGLILEQTLFQINTETKSIFNYDKLEEVVLKVLNKQVPDLNITFMELNNSSPFYKIESTVIQQESDILALKNLLHAQKIAIISPLFEEDIAKKKKLFIIFKEKENKNPYFKEELYFIEQILVKLKIEFQKVEVNEKNISFNEILKKKVNEQNKQLLLAYDELKNLDRAKSDFISIASHQLRTPISVIRGYLGLLIHGDYGKIKDTQILQVLKNSNENVERLASIVNEILDASRIEQGRLSINLEKTDLIKMIKKVYQAHRPAAKEKGIELTFIDPKEKKIEVFCDPEKIYEVIANVVDNAVQYTSEGKVEITVKPRINHVIIIVSDTGIGIPDNFKDKMFRRFARHEKAKRVKPDGTGIGLFTAKNILQAHKGEIWFNSIEGKGTTFFIKLLRNVPKQEPKKL